MPKRRDTVTHDIIEIANRSRIISRKIPIPLRRNQRDYSLLNIDNDEDWTLGQLWQGVLKEFKFLDTKCILMEILIIGFDARKY